MRVCQALELLLFTLRIYSPLCFVQAERSYFSTRHFFILSFYILFYHSVATNCSINEKKNKYIVEHGRQIHNIVNIIIDRDLILSKFGSVQFENW